MSIYSINKVLQSGRMKPVYETDSLDMFTERLRTMELAHAESPYVRSHHRLEFKDGSRMAAMQDVVINGSRMMVTLSQEFISAINAAIA